MYIDKLSEAPQLVTFSDLMLLPGRTETDPSDVELQSHITKNISVKIPYIASPMDTVTESQMAISIARAGGVGVLHRNCSIDEEVRMARQVKRAESFVITDVITVDPSMEVKKAKQIMKKHDISGLPVVNGEDQVVGILTKRDVRFANDDANVAEMMSAEVIAAQKDISIEKAQKLLHEHRIEKLVVIDDNEKLEGLVTVKDLERRGQFPDASRDDNGRLIVGAAIGPFDEKRAKNLDDYVDFIVVDLAHGHNMNALRSASKINDMVSAEMIYGNLGSQESVEDVVSHMEEVAGLRVGIGSGSICSTSVVTSASSPTLYSTLQVASKVEDMGMNIPVISDGGIRNPGDAALCFTSGASAVMMGSMFAGCRESPGELLAIEGKMMKSIRGMGSRSAKAVRHALDRYSEPAKSVPEGVEGYVPFRGNVADVIDEFTSGLKAAFGYAGAADIEEIRNSGKMGKISSQGLEETQPHDIYPSAGNFADGSSSF